ncbi:MAG: hypothetical protein AVDCRST_MAG33-2854, partial [uncultured Thermomicrobiales bacterium]
WRRATTRVSRWPGRPGNCMAASRWTATRSCPARQR